MTIPADPAGDPDRFVPDAPNPSPRSNSGPLDRSQDPDRFDPMAPPLRTSGPTLPELLGAGAQVEERNGYTWLIGLGAVIGFLLLISLLVQVGSR